MIAKMVSHAWKVLADQERDMWHQMAARDKARFEYEKANYNGRWKVPRNEKPHKDPRAPKRPITAFLAFSNHYRESVRAKNPGMKTTGISKILAHMWRDAPIEERQFYLEQDLQQRKRYRAALQQYKARKALDRRQREAIALKKAEMSGMCKSILHQVVSFESADDDNTTYTEETSFEDDEWEPLPLYYSRMDMDSLQDCLDVLAPDDFNPSITSTKDIMSMDWTSGRFSSVDRMLQWRKGDSSTMEQSLFGSKTNTECNVAICEDDASERIPFPSFEDQVEDIRPDLPMSCFSSVKI
jgi:hypothetical protein